VINRGSYRKNLFSEEAEWEALERALEEAEITYRRRARLSRPVQGLGGGAGGDVLKRV